MWLRLLYPLPISCFAQVFLFATFASHIMSHLIAAKRLLPPPSRVIPCSMGLVVFPLFPAPGCRIALDQLFMVMVVGENVRAVHRALHNWRFR